MTTSVKFLGHASFQIRTGVHSILIDPFLTGNPQASTTADELDADAILVTHGHEDHVADVESIARRTGALVVANFEITTWFQSRGIENAHPMHIGGQHSFDFGIVKLTIAHHGSMLPDGSNGGNPAGIVLKTADGNIYHAGDTGLFSDMQLIGDEGIRVAILPIGDNFTMGPDDSIKATRYLKPEIVIPAHFNTWPLIEQDTDAWQQQVKLETEAQPVVLSPGDVYTLPSA
ncbi:MAG: metal-dependent hydrolase [Planctomycetaceae bacterium]|jgi:L-ascorbate metabolism protein UlaG (beta-lactamase superfamily)